MNEESKVVYESPDKNIKILQAPDGSFFVCYHEDFKQNAITFLDGFEAGWKSNIKK